MIGTCWVARLRTSSSSKHSKSPPPHTTGHVRPSADSHSTSLEEELRHDIKMFFILRRADRTEQLWSRSLSSGRRQLEATQSRVRAPPQHVPPGISGRRAAWLIRWTEDVIRASTVNNASGQSNVRRRRNRTRKTFPVATLQLLVVASQRRCKNRAYPREVFFSSASYGRSQMHHLETAAG